MVWSDVGKDNLTCSINLVEKAPTILFRHQNGPIAQSNDGKLIVYPGTTLHMECLWMRRFGNPKWNVSHVHKWVLESIFVLFKFVFYNDFFYLQKWDPFVNENYPFKIRVFFRF